MREVGRSPGGDWVDDLLQHRESLVLAANKENQLDHIACWVGRESVHALGVGSTSVNSVDTDISFAGTLKFALLANRLIATAFGTNPESKSMP